MADSDKKIKSKEKILNSAKINFIDKGFDGTSVDDIAKTAGLTKSLLYYYYDSKDSILIDLMENTIDNVVRRLGEARKKHIPENFEELVNQAVASLSDEMDVLRIALAEALKASSKTCAVFELPAKIFNEYQNEFNFSEREKLLFCLFAIKIITFYSVKDKLSSSFGIDKDEVEDLFKRNMEPIFYEITK